MESKKGVCVCECEGWGVERDGGIGREERKKGGSEGGREGGVGVGRVW